MCADVTKSDSCGLRSRTFARLRWKVACTDTLGAEDASCALAGRWERTRHRYGWVVPSDTGQVFGPHFGRLNTSSLPVCYTRVGPFKRIRDR